MRMLTQKPSDLPKALASAARLCALFVPLVAHEPRSLYSLTRVVRLVGVDLDSCRCVFLFGLGAGLRLRLGAEGIKSGSVYAQ